MFDAGIDGDAGLSADGQGFEAQSAGESELHSGRREDDRRGLLEPAAKGRKIFGGLVPYGEVWRAGANEATTFVTTTALMVGSAHVPAGNYTIFAIPNKDKWTLVISKKTGEWGIPYPGPSEDLARIDMKASTLPSAVENFTIAFDKTAGGCTLRMDWETTRASVDISKM